MLVIPVATAFDLGISFIYCLMVTIIGSLAIFLALKNIKRPERIFEVLFSPDDANYNEGDKDLYKLKKLLKDFISLFFNSPL